MADRSQISPLKLAFDALQKAEARVAELERKLNEPIAIVGMGCRIPGGGTGPDGYWSLLRDRRNAISGAAPHRWTRLGAPHALEPLPPAARWTGLLDDVEHFDPQFFGISPREALGMDPQQRILLEASWEALENASIAPSSLYESSTGVYFAICGSDYQQIQVLSSGLDAMDAHFASGVAHSVASGRIAYVLGLQGPAISIDTACSSSLVAVHLACQGLRGGDCHVALAGGINLVLAPDPAVMYYRSGMLSEDGQCKAFDSRADGFVRGEGCGVVVLKRLSDALADNDPILAVIRGSAVNQDGPASGLTVPNGTAQRALLRSALASAGVKPAQVGYVEAHGTGTVLGDPIEAQALGAVFGQGRDPSRPLLIGSVKTNVGHLEAAAGIAGLLKVVLGLQHRQIPAQLHAGQLNPHIPWEQLPLRVVRDLTPWEPIDGRRIAGVSSFGFSGTNGHIVIEEAPARAVPPGERERPVHVAALSARTDSALRTLAASYTAYLKQHPESHWQDICHTANVGRSHFSERLTISAANAQEAVSALEAFDANQVHGAIRGGQAKIGQPPRIAFLFTGQGSQYAGMGKELYENCLPFRNALDRCEAILREELDVPLGSVIRGDHPLAGTLIDQTLYTQPALFAFEYALAQAWASWGVTPGLVAGHSLGEYVAAVVAGAVDLESVLRLVARRARLMHEVREDGAMLAIEAPEAEVREALIGSLEQVSLAAVNGPVQMVISGYREAVEKIGAILEARGRQVKRLRVSQAFHSPILDRIVPAFENAALQVAWGAPRIRLLSNLDGAPIESLSASYWAKQMRRTAQFRAQIQTLQRMNFNTIVEIGPRPVLIPLAQANVEPAGWGCWIPSLRPFDAQRPGTGDWPSIARAVQELYAAGVDMNWSAWDRGFTRRRLVLPTYPFERSRYWTAHNGQRTEKRAGKPAGHPLLGTRLESPLDGAQFEAVLFAAGENEWIAGHRLDGRVIMPATGFMEAMLTAGQIALGSDWRELHDLVLLTPLVFQGDSPCRVQVIVDAPQNTAARVRFFSAQPDENGENWRLHAEGRMVRAASAPATPSEGLISCRDAAVNQISGEMFYAHASEKGADFGPAFQRLEDFRWTEGQGVARVRNAAGTAWRVHPAVLDAAIQAGAGVLANPDSLHMPVAVGRYVWLARPCGQICHALVQVIKAGDSAFDATIGLYDEDMTPVARVENMRLQKAPSGEITDAELRGWLYRIEWVPSSLPDRAAAPTGSTLIIAAPGDPIAEGTEAILRNRGYGVTRVAHDSQSLAAALRDGSIQRALLFPPLLDQSIASPSEAQRPRITALLDLLAALRKSGGTPRLYLVTRNVCALTPAGPPPDLADAPLSGAVSALALEQPELRATRIDVDGSDPRGAAAAVCAEVSADSGDDSSAWRAGSRFVARLRRCSAESTAEFAPGHAPLRLTAGGTAGFDSLLWTPIEHGALAPREMEIRVRSAALNFHDVLTALGVLTDPDPLGAECSGVVVRVGSAVSRFKAGDSVMSLAPDCFGSFAVGREDLTIPMPPSFSWDAAAAQSMAYLTADYCLNVVARIKPGDRVLIHAATGGVGLAAVQICRRAGVEVLATAGNDEKRAYLRSLGIHHVMDSRSLDFAQQTMRATDRKGVDVLLNSLAGPFIDAGLSIMARDGRFVEIGKTDLREPEDVRRQFPGVEYTSIYLTNQLLRDPDFMRSRLQAIVDRIVSGDLDFLPHQSFPLKDAPDAFRRMALAKHIGKIVLTCSISEMDRQLIRKDGAYVVTGGLGGVGFEVAKWLAARGAGELVLAGRRTPSNEVQSAIAELRAQGKSISVVNADVAAPAGAESILSAVSRPLSGIFHCAGVYDDAPIPALNGERFERAMRPKLDGAMNLHRLTAGKNLDLFVCFSSLASVGGSPGQANYCAANAFLDALAHYRRSLGLPSLTVNWGAWDRAGQATSEIVRKRLAEMGAKLMPPADALRAFEMTLQKDAGAQITIAAIHWQRFFSAQASRRQASVYAEFQPIAATDSAPHPNLDFVAALEQEPPARRSAKLVARLQQLAATVLGLGSPASIDPEQPLHDLGMDSLIAVELRNSVSAAFGRTLPATILFDYPTVATLAAHLERILFTAEVEAEPSAKSESASVLDMIELMSDEEVDRLLSRNVGRSPG